MMTEFTKEQLDAAVKEAVTAATADADKRIEAMDSKVNELLDEKKAASNKAKEAEAAAQKALDDAARKGGDVEALEASWQAKYDALQVASDEKAAGLSKAVEKLTVGQTATTLAAELAVQGSSTVVERIIKDRLTVEMSDTGPVVKVLDASGKPSASTLDDLKAELQADKALAPIMAASKASGGGAAGANGGAGSKLEGNAAIISAKVPGFADLPKS